MEISKLKKYLKIYLDSIITPKVNRHFESQEGYKPVTISIYDIKPKEHLPEEMSIFLDIDPDLPSGYYVAKTISKDIKDFIFSLGIRKLINIQWNKRPLY
jgi:hypothetical protein